ncbi:MAG: pepSY-associated helix, partial [Caulobacteraceae bacterium]|nr:pepSY-associated helix [Caulobacteraceae bacterium]
MVTHRYAGILVGLLMLLWCLSGVVMLFVHWPQVTEEERLSGLAPIDWARCCDFGGAILDVQTVHGASVEAVAGRPVLRADGQVIDLTSGRPIRHFGEADARAVAETFADRRDIMGEPARAALVERDQWTVTGYFNSARPFWRVRLSDPAATDLYVSAKTGKVAQRTTRPARILNWLGPIPHWLYPQVLRADTKLWSQVVIWTSIAGVFLTVTGLYLGVVAWRPGARVTPFHGL